MQEEIIEYLKSLREEIHLRIQQHTRLVWIKVGTLGVMISFLVGTCYGTNVSESLRDLLYYVVWVVPLAAVVFDILIASNLRDINNLGYYIKTYIEGEAFDEIRNMINEELDMKSLFRLSIANGGESLDKVLDRRTIPDNLRKEFKDCGFSLSKYWPLISKNATVEVKKSGQEWEIADERRKFIVRKDGDHLNVKHLKFGFWEEKAAQADPKYHCYTWPDMVVIWLFTLVPGFFTVMLRCHHGFDWKDTIFIIICIIGNIFAIWCLIRSIKMERRF